MIYQVITLYMSSDVPLTVKSLWNSNNCTSMSGTCLWMKIHLSSYKIHRLRVLQIASLFMHIFNNNIINNL